MGKKILIIDDDRVIQDSLQELFADAGYVVHLAADGISGFELISQGKAGSDRDRYPSAQDARDRFVRKDQGQ